MRAEKAERQILGILLLYPEMMKEVTSPPRALCEDDFLTVFNRRVFAAMCAPYDAYGTVDIGYLGESFSDEEIGRITEMQVARSALTVNTVSVVDENMRVLRAEKRNARESDQPPGNDALQNLLARRRSEKK